MKSKINIMYAINLIAMGLSAICIFTNLLFISISLRYEYVSLDTTNVITQITELYPRYSLLLGSLGLGFEILSFTSFMFHFIKLKQYEGMSNTMLKKLVINVTAFVVALLAFITCM